MVLRFFFLLTCLCGFSHAEPGHERLGTQIFAKVSSQRDAKDINQIMLNEVKAESVRVLSEVNQLFSNVPLANDNEVSFLEVRVDSPPHLRMKALLDLTEHLNRPAQFTG